MSHADHKTHCPNCGYEADLNYCARCGQPTHLHKETFWGLVTHFAAHYFHYDSKFMQTLKALWFSPGKLTLAYWREQRMRYIPPISLYIFISAVFFLCAMNISGGMVPWREHPDQVRSSSKSTDIELNLNYQIAQSNAEGYFEQQADKITAKYGSTTEFFVDKTNHNFTKLFFFTIPILAVILKLFIRRKDMMFVDHAVFSLHYHSFWFSIFTINALYVFRPFHDELKVLLWGIAFLYLVIALHKAYHIGWARSIVYALSVSILYLIALLLAIIVMLVCFFVMV